MKHNLVAIALLTIGLLLLLLLTACSNHRRPPVRDDKLIVHIHSDGTKLFAYAVANGGPGRNPDSGPPPGGRTPPGGADMPTGYGRGDGKTPGDTDSSLINELELKLSMTGYCRDGYIEMERYTYQNARWVRGECREAASEQDRAQFGSRISLF